MMRPARPFLTLVWGALSAVALAGPLGLQAMVAPPPQPIDPDSIVMTFRGA